MKRSLLLAGMMLASGWVAAAPEVTFRGFGTLGAVHNFSDGAATIRDIGQPDGPRGETSFDMDTRLGGQLDMDLTPQLSATVQAVSRYGYRGTYTPTASLAFLKYTFGGNYEVRLGRIGWDVYAGSDSRQVGYSYLWVRPPVDYFGKLTADWLDGVDFRFSHLLDSGVLSGKLYAGYNFENVALNRDSYSDQNGSTIFGGHLEYQQGDWTFRLSAARANSESELRGERGRNFRALMESADPAVLAALKTLGLDKPRIDVDLLAAAVTYDSGPFQSQFMLSYDKYRNTPLGDTTLRGFLSASYRLGDWRPYVVVSGVHSSDVDFPMVPGMAISSLEEHQDTLSIGVRYDFHENIALKLQVDHHNVHREGRQSVLWREVQADWDGKVNQLSLTLDFVF